MSNSLPQGLYNVYLSQLRTLCRKDPESHVVPFARFVSTFYGRKRFTNPEFRDMYRDYSISQVYLNQLVRLHCPEPTRHMRAFMKFVSDNHGREHFTNQQFSDFFAEYCAANGITLRSQSPAPSAPSEPPAPSAAPPAADTTDSSGFVHPFSPLPDNIEWCPAIAVGNIMVQYVRGTEAASRHSSEVAEGEHTN